MKSYLPALLLMVCSCSDGPQENKETTNKALEAATDISTVKSDTVCFTRTEGARHQDTAAVRLIISNDQVSGKMMYLPYEKDRRLGNLKGRKEGDEISCMWIYMQEGMIDSMEVAFKIEGNKLRQKLSSIDKENGKEFLSDTALYRREYERTDCGKSPVHDFDFENIH